MNVEIPNEIIDELVKKEVTNRVKSWFSDSKNKDFMRNTIIEVAKQEASTRLADCHMDVDKLVQNFDKKELTRQIAEHIGDGIAEYFCSKYDN